MKYKITLAFLLTALFAVATIAETKSDYDRKFDFSRLRTWDFKVLTRMPNDPVAENELWDRRIRDGLISHFTEVRFTKVDDSEPTFLVNYFMGLEKKYDVRYINYGYPADFESVSGYGHWYGWGPGYGHVDAWSIPYTESTLIVDVIDPRTNHLVWRGYDTQTIDFEKSEKTIHKSVENLTKRFRHDVNKRLKRVG
jgi:Domain of unknown function (DUF4136)